MRGRARKVCGSKPFAEGLVEAHERARKSLSESSKPFRGNKSQNSAEKTFAEAAEKGGSKKDYKRYSRKDRGRVSRKG